jgi:predicted esterase
MRMISVETPTHGRVLIKDAAASTSRSRLLVGFHGYAQNAEEMLAELERIPGSEQWTLVSAQALHRFYTRGDEKVVASWMTRQDRELAIADNVVYVDHVVEALLREFPKETRIVFAGFSQGVAMAYRAAILGAYRVQGLIAVGGDVPPEVKNALANRFPEILIAAGERDPFYTPAKVAADEAILRSMGVRPEIFRYSGGHEWTDELRGRIHLAIARWE